ncbi:MAG: integrase core domain-containing protein [Chitinophagales bacterium]
MLALELALKNRQFPKRSLIHHSDRGVQYCSFAYIEKLTENNIRISMTQSGSPYENAMAESINGTLKVDFDLAQIFDNYEHALQIVNQSIANYNTVRPHGSINYLTPQKAHLKTGELKNRWRKKQVVDKQENTKLT